jgi:hypothetical protein
MLTTENNMTDNFIPLYDLESLSEAQRQDYIRNVCKHMGVPDNLNLVALTYVDDGEGPSRLVAYAKRGATENVRNNLQIDVTSLTNQMIGGSIVFTATAKSKLSGRQEISTGSKYIDGLAGTALDDGIMTAQTRALRRVTLQFVGAGVLDESEVNQRKLVHVASSTIATVPQPIAPPSNLPGLDVTPAVAMTQADMVAVGITPVFLSLPAIAEPAVSLMDETKRLQAIEQLNQQVEPKAKKTRKKRSTVDLGPSDNPVTSQPPAPVTVPVEPVTVPVEPVKEAAPVEQVVSAPTAITVAPLTAPPAQKIPKLSLEQVKPYRQRLFRLRNDYLEPAGFAPKEGMGTADQLRSLAQVMFADIQDMNDLTVEQWEKYLRTLESKVQSESASSAVKFIEETIGL